MEQSIVALPIKVQGGTITIEIQAADYWKFVNDGVQGVGGKKADGSQWAKKNTTSPFSYKPDRKPSVKHFIDWSRLAGKSPFAVRETVFRSGTKGNKFFDEVINDKFENELATRLTEMLSRAIEVDIKTDFDGK